MKRKILYIHQYFKTPDEPGGTRSYWIAKALIEAGYEVTMVSAKNNLKNKLSLEEIEGIKVVYFRIDYENSMSIIKRCLSFFRFMYRTTIYIIKSKPYDMVIATSTPLTVGIPALILKKIKKTPFLFEVRDLWPEVPIQMGGINNFILKWIAIKLEKVIYNSAKHIIALSPGMAEGVSKYVDKAKITMIPNMSKIDLFFPRMKELGLFEKYNLNVSTLKIIHFGTLGKANGIFTIIESAKLLKDVSDIEFLFLGGGGMETRLKEECDKFGLNNVFFLGSYPMMETSEIVNLCDISIISFLNLPILYTNSPNKLFDSLSAGKTIIVNSAGWTKELVEKNNCGYYINPENPTELAELLLYLEKNRSLLGIHGLAARNLAERVYDKSILCLKFVAVIDDYFFKF